MAVDELIKRLEEEIKKKYLSGEDVKKLHDEMQGAVTRVFRKLHDEVQGKYLSGEDVKKLHDEMQGAVTRVFRKYFEYKARVADLKEENAAFREGAIAVEQEQRERFVSGIFAGMSSYDKMAVAAMSIMFIMFVVAIVIAANMK